MISSAAAATAIADIPRRMRRFSRSSRSILSSIVIASPLDR
jgi:hypothetical protein